MREPVSTASASPPLHRLTSPLAAALVLFLFWLLLIASTWNKSATIDEPGSPAAGITHWKFNDYRLDPENGNLLHRLSALPFLGTHLPELTQRAWLNPEPWDFGEAWLHHPDNATIGMLHRGRAVMALVAVALAALVWHCSRTIFGPVGGMISLLVCVLNPTVLANGPLMTADTLAALFFLAATWSWWRLLHQIDAPRLIFSILATSGLLVSKMSGVLIVPIALVLLIARLTEDRRQLRTLLAVCGAHILAVYAILWACYGFRYSMLAADRPSTQGSSWLWEPLLEPPSLPEAIEQLDLPGDTLRRARAVVMKYSVPLEGWTDLSDTALAELRREVLTPTQATALEARTSDRSPKGVARAILFAARHKLLPEAYLVGSLHAVRSTAMRWAFLNGERYYVGKPWFFPYTFAVKTPLPFLGLLALSAAAALSARRKPPQPVGAESCLSPQPPVALTLHAFLPIGVLFVCYALSALSSGINIGHRHILTLYPPLFIFAGAAGAWWQAGAGRRKVGPCISVLLAIQAAEIGFRFPNYLSYFNGIVSPSTAHRHLVDSSLDWGQDLPGVGEYIRTHPSEGPFHLSYFGAGNPKTYGIEANFLPSVPDRFRSENLPVISARIASNAPSREEIAAFARTHSAYNVVGAGTDEKNQPVAYLMRRPAAWRLTAGTYFISATRLQLPPWGEIEEANYQRLSRQTRPLVSPTSTDEFLQALGQLSVKQGAEILLEFERARTDRLSAYFRPRPPASTIGNSILVYKLTESEITHALVGPPLAGAPSPPP